MKIFQLNDDQLAKIETWKKEQNLAAVEKQKENPPDVPKDLLEQFWANGYPYGGAIGGELTYSFSPTSIGVQAEVIHAFTGEILDVTEYHTW